MVDFRCFCCFFVRMAVIERISMARTMSVGAGDGTISSINLEWPEMVGSGEF